MIGVYISIGYDSQSLYRTPLRIVLSPSFFAALSPQIFGLGPQLLCHTHIIKVKGSKGLRLTFMGPSKKSNGDHFKDSLYTQRRCCGIRNFNCAFLPAAYYIYCSTKSRGFKIMMPLCPANFNKCLSPLTMISHFPAMAHSMNLSSSGSSHMDITMPSVSMNWP